MFDHLEWWQVLLVLAPISGLMHLIRYREVVASSTAFRDMTLEQKAFVLLSLMPPNASAKIWLEVPDAARNEIIVSASALRGSGRNLHDPLIKEFLAQVPKKLKDGEAADLHERFCNVFRVDAAEGRRLFLNQYGSALRRTVAKSEV